MFDRRERELERESVTYGADLTLKTIYDLKKEFQEFKAVVLEREKMREKMWGDRLVFLGLLIASWAITTGILLHSTGTF
ncbi:MAG: hypothetical protein WCD81_05455 [Candidatus Bathyarchaeia archaeon]